MEFEFKKYWRKTSLKKKKDGNFLLNHIKKHKPKNFLEIGVFHGVTSRNVCELLYLLHGDKFKFTGIDLFLNSDEIEKDEYTPKTTFSNPLKTIFRTENLKTFLRIKILFSVLKFYFSVFSDFTPQSSY